LVIDLQDSPMLQATLRTATRGVSGQGKGRPFVHARPAALARDAEPLNCLPHPPMIVGHLRMHEPEMREGVVDRVREGGNAADIERFAHTLGADRMMRRR